jgi:hypothetical protein
MATSRRRAGLGRVRRAVAKAFAIPVDEWRGTRMPDEDMIDVRTTARPEGDNKGRVVVTAGVRCRKDAEWQAVEETIGRVMHEVTALLVGSGIPMPLPMPPPPEKTLHRDDSGS